MGAAAVLTQGEGLSAEVDENLIAILNDTHVGGNQPENSAIPTHLSETVAYLTGLPRLPVAVVINGDLALNNGRPEDYTHFAKLIAPLRDACISVYLTMGNHDDRDVFYEVLKTEKPETSVVASKHVGVVPTAKANLFLVNSLKARLMAQGLLGDEQLAWLAKVLDAHADKPALVFAHHNPRLGGDEKHFPGGLEDSEQLWELLVSRRQVKAYVHGHIHHRDFFNHRGIHIINTPATSFVSNPKESTTGWTRARLTPSGGSFTTHTHLPEHAWNGARADLKWSA